MLILQDNELLHIDTSTDYLEHYGVKGMKWGKRKLNQVYDNHVENLKYKYRKKGYSEDEVNEKLRKRLRNEKALALAAGSAIAAYSIYKGGRYVKDEFVGTTFKKGGKVNTVMDKDIDYNKHFYSYNNKHDKRRYDNLYAEHLRLSGRNPYRVTTEFTSDVKIAPNRVAKKEFKKLYKNDKTFREKVDAIPRDVNGTSFKSKYDKFNAMAPYTVDDQWKKYQKSILKKGYSGIQDRNDVKYSGYGSKNPVIMFDPKKMKQIGKSKIESNDKEYTKVEVELVTKQLAKTLAIPATALGTSIAVGKYQENTDTRLRDKKYNKKYKTRKKSR